MMSRGLLNLLGVNPEGNGVMDTRTMLENGDIDPQQATLLSGLLGMEAPIDPGNSFREYMAGQGGARGFFGSALNPILSRAMFSDDYNQFREQKARHDLLAPVYKDQIATQFMAEGLKPVEEMLSNDDPTDDIAALRIGARLQPDVYAPVLRERMQSDLNPTRETYTEGDYQRNPETGRWELVQQGSFGDIKRTAMPEGFVPENRMMSPDKVEDAIGEFDQAAFDSTQRLDNIVALESTMDEIGEEAWTAGLRGEVSETWKQVTGTEDPVSMARKQYEGIRTSKAVQNLPPGVASDKDIELVLKPFPTSFTNYQQLREYIAGLRRGEQKIREYNQFGARYLSRPGGGSRRGMAEAWDSHWKEQTSEGGKFYNEGGAGETPKHSWTFADEDK